MPFYEYQCGDCDHRLEVLQKISDEPLVFCPQCSEASLKKLISAAAFRLKGSGWYETDFKDNNKQKEKSSTGKSSDGESKPSSSSDKPSSSNGNASQPKDTSAKDAPSKSASSKEGAASSATQV